MNQQKAVLTPIFAISRSKLVHMFPETAANAFLPLKSIWSKRDAAGLPRIDIDMCDLIGPIHGPIEMVDRHAHAHAKTRC